MISRENPRLRDRPERTDERAIAIAAARGSGGVLDSGTPSSRADDDGFAAFLESIDDRALRRDGASTLRR
jgi:hypothetical protein